MRSLRVVARPFGPVLILLVILGGCVTVPPEAPELSAELGNRLNAIEQSHLVVMRRFFDLKRAEVDRFLQTEWVPVFAEEIFSDPVMAEAWNTVVREDDAAQRLQLILRVAPRIQSHINAKRLELVQPLDDIERRVEQAVRDEYAQAKSINQTITSFLMSASRVSETRTRYLEMAGISDDEIGATIDEVNDAVNALVGKADAVLDAVEQTNDYLAKLKALRDQIRPKAGGS